MKKSKLLAKFKELRRMIEAGVHQNIVLMTINDAIGIAAPVSALKRRIAKHANLKVGI